jgi:hypothetical protein
MTEKLTSMTEEELRQLQQQGRDCAMPSYHRTGVRVVETGSTNILEQFHFEVDGVGANLRKRMMDALESVYALGVFEGLWNSERSLREKLAVVEEIRRERAKRAGAAGGDAVSSSAAQRAAEILYEYRKWAGDSDNGRTINQFAETLAAKRGREKGFRKSTIARVIMKFEDAIVHERKQYDTKVIGTGTLIKLVAEKLDGKPGVSRETVRRAFS